ncbi:hypothetical protein B0H14DRAFT_2636095 [Mycena olivaceomarginata]|nr:hypothetical protein B0H14DRAFT_2636095 [Mycena olivaceomarginata]
MVRVQVGWREWRAPVRVVQVPVWGQSGQGMRLPADVPMHTSASTSGGAGSASTGVGGGGKCAVELGTRGREGGMQLPTPTPRDGVSPGLASCQQVLDYCALQHQQHPATLVGPFVPQGLSLAGHRQTSTQAQQVHTEDFILRMRSNSLLQKRQPVPLELNQMQHHKLDVGSANTGGCMAMYGKRKSNSRTAT